jgi:dTDP-4-dehydrorhamnose reductase
VRAAVVGAHGQLGRALSACLGPRAIWTGGRGDLDVRDEGAVRRRLAELRPDVVFNASAYNAVDAAETRFSEALAVNAEGPAHLARAAREVGALCVHVSTDYVFDGRATQPYTESQRPAPLGLYGVSKLAGEHAVAAAGGEHLIVRTSGVFGSGGSQVKGGSFVERILARARTGQPLRVVADQVFAPTYAPDLARALVTLAERGARGLVHVSNGGCCSWHALAVAALEIAGVAAPVAPIAAEELNQPARRPAYSVLASERAEALGLAPLRGWREALVEHLTP